MQDLITFFTNHITLTLPALIVIILVVIVEFIRTKRTSFNVSPIQTTQMINHDNAVIIDVRANDLYRKGHIIDAYSLTFQEIKEGPKKLEKFRSRPVIIVCSNGVESQKIAALLLKQGYNAHSLAGGIRAWNEAQMPLIKG